MSREVVLMGEKHQKKHLPFWGLFLSKAILLSVSHFSSVHSSPKQHRRAFAASIVVEL